MGTGYVWYDLPPAEIAGRKIALSLCFFGQDLESVSLAVVDANFDGASWGDWTPATEQARAEATEQWLETLGYPLGTYGWGTVYAGTDPKTGDSSGGVRFR